MPSDGWSTRQVLTLERIHVSDAGEYMCQAKNSINAQNSSSFHVYVLCECCLLHPTACDSLLLTVNCDLLLPVSVIHCFQSVIYS